MAKQAGKAPPVHTSEDAEFQKRPSLCDVIGAPNADKQGGEDEKHVRLGSKGFANK